MSVLRGTGGEGGEGDAQRCGATISLPLGAGGEQELRTLRALLDGTPDAMLCVDARGCIVFVNAEAERLFGHDRDELLGQPVETLVPGASRQTHARLRADYLTQPVHRPMGEGRQLAGRRRDGTEFPADISLRAVETESGLIVSATVRDVTEQVQAAARFRLLTENACDVIGAATPDGRITYLSPSTRSVLGWDPQAVIGRSAFEFAHPDDLAHAEAFLRRILEEAPAVATTEVRVLRVDGSHVWTEVAGRATSGPRPGTAEVEFAVRDVSERKSAQAALERQALTDPLTGLANRAVLLDRVGVALRSLSRNAGLVALLVVDLDRFKVINDSLGHLAGDEVLVAVGQRLRTLARPADTVARLGGDEFALLAEGLRNARDVSLLADRIVAACREPREVHGGLVVTASVGIAATHRSEHLPDDLLREADLALYRAKDRGRDRHELFDAEMQARATARLDVERRLRAAVTELRLRLEYQPIVELDSGDIHEAEALVRVEDGSRGLLRPDSFLGVAADTGLLTRIDRWVRETAVGQLAAWRVASPRPAIGRLAVNVTAQDLADSRFVGGILEVLEDGGVPPGALAIELTEQALLRTTHLTLATLDGLHDAGVRVGLDDFGTGFSSFSHLQNFPLDFVKVDRAFISRVGREERSTSIVEAVIRLAHALDLGVVAEGVETDLQRDTLRALGCDRAQGHLFAPSLSAPELVELLGSRGGGVGTGDPIGPAGSPGGGAGQPAAERAGVRPGVRPPEEVTRRR